MQGGKVGWQENGGLVQGGGGRRGRKKREKKAMFLRCLFFLFSFFLFLRFLFFFFFFFLFFFFFSSLFFVHFSSEESLVPNTATADSNKKKPFSFLQRMEVCTFSIQIKKEFTMIGTKWLATTRQRKT
eukprot:TRINITY_DN123_c0_g1_i9.p2 TRINITY_DN123_c0_g1~~TRINITY_DN123_c0_g1_i9.p2  ORF type:complete len:128 (-),score=13.78 TRINITY_DN123_c0_g1_i9:20-403(-)